MSPHTKPHDLDPALPPSSDVPENEPAPLAELVVPNPAIAFGGMDNIPEKLLSEEEQVADELDHAGLDQTLPGEEAARPATEPKFA